MGEHDPEPEKVKFPEVEYTKDSQELYINILRAYSEGKKCICEIGTGLSTTIFSESAVKNMGHVWSIDVKNRPGVTQAVTFFNEDSIYLTWSRFIDLLYIDGNHEARQVRRELIIYGYSVVNGGFILLDDCRHDGRATTYLPDDLLPVVKEFCWLNGLEWQFCAPPPNKIVAIYVHKMIGPGR